MKFEKVLHLREKKTSNMTKCSLLGLWYDTAVKIGDVVSVKGVWNDERQRYIVTSTDGLIVTSPDTLISGTRVVGSLFCPRKSVLAERFQPVETGDCRQVRKLINFSRTCK